MIGSIVASNLSNNRRKNKKNKIRVIKKLKTFLGKERCHKTGCYKIKRQFKYKTLLTLKRSQTLTT